VRCAYVFAHGITGGFYPGELLNLLPEHRRAEVEAFKSKCIGRVIKTSGGDTVQQTCSLSECTLVCASLALSAYARVLLFFGVIASLGVMLLPKVRSHFLMRTALAVAMYQVVMCVIVYANPMYYSASYVFVLLCLVVVAAVVRELWDHRRTAKQASLPACADTNIRAPRQ